jgi:hypothetical protein
VGTFEPQNLTSHHDLFQPVEWCEYCIENYALFEKLGKSMTENFFSCEVGSILLSVGSGLSLVGGVNPPGAQGLPDSFMQYLLTLQEGMVNHDDEQLLDLVTAQTTIAPLSDPIVQPLLVVSGGNTLPRGGKHLPVMPSSSPKISLAQLRQSILSSLCELKSSSSAPLNLLERPMEQVSAELTSDVTVGNLTPNLLSRAGADSLLSLWAGPSGIETAPSTSNLQTASHALSEQTIDVPLRDARWAESLGNRVMWMLNQDKAGAELKLHPPQLGPLEIHVSLEGEHTSVSFIAHHAAVREALESAIPKLREMLGSGGLNLANVDVSQQNLPQQQNGESRHPYFSNEGSETELEYGLASHEDRLDRVRNNVTALVDYFV